MNETQTESYISHFKTGNSMVDYMVMSMIMSFITKLFTHIQFWFEYHFDWLKIVNYFSNNNSVSYEGKVCVNYDRFSCQFTQSIVFSDQFKALWNHIIKDVDENDTIRHIKEYMLGTSNETIYMVNQYNQFLVCPKKQIYAVSYIRQNAETQEKRTGDTNKIDYIIVELFSKKSGVKEIKDYVDEITKEYLDTIEESRNNKKFIYTLDKATYEDNSCECWNETQFESTRSFKNIFFDKKEEVLSKVDFFLANRDWYYEKGIPYTMGIGLYGPPGTGKTSFIKALANYSDRHIVSISLKVVKTRKQLEAVFFEDRYNKDNRKCSISFNKKIVVFEDIDCIGDIVKERKVEKKKVEEDVSNDGDLKKDKKKDLLCPLLEEDLITLDDILELWDGLREATGRIMIITSNHYDKLDHALRRPGRIDITLEMSYASRKTIGEMYKHLVGEEVDRSKLEQVNDRFYTPAEITNVYMNERQGMMERLLKNERVM
jgi:ATP-dependent 26S proteasome regulatory subunit